MSIHIRGLSPQTYSALERLCSERQWPEVYDWMEPETVAWLTFRLEFVKDDADTFPKGKWATIQRLQDIVREYAASESRALIERQEAG